VLLGSRYFEISIFHSKGGRFEEMVRSFGNCFGLGANFGQLPSGTGQTFGLSRGGFEYSDW
jgi:hypothetical protein